MSVDRGAPTLIDVARRAGVHPATVSRALARPNMVAPKTRQVVLDAVDEVGFVPNRSARHLVSGRAGAIGVIVPDIANPYFATILQAIQADAREHDLGVLIADTGADADAERLALARLGRQVDGLVVLTPVTDLSSSTVPTVQINRQSRLAPSVVVDQAAVVSLAVDHLAGLGHRQVAVVRGPASYWSSTQRARAIDRVGDARDLPPRLVSVGPVPATFDGGRSVLDAVLETGATGVVAFNDVQATGILVAAQQRGIVVPDDLSVVGSDGLDLAAMTGPPLTTVAAPLAHIGHAAQARLADLLAERPGAQRTVLPPELIVRASTSVPAQRRRPDPRPRSNDVHPG